MLSTSQDNNSFPVAIVVSLFNREITQALQDGAIKRFLSRGFHTDQITVIEVPGAVEIPLIAQQLSKKKKFKAIIALGAVIRGETSHYDYVCQQVSWGCQHVALNNNIPVIFGILTTENETQAWERLGGKHGHKGMDAADAAIDMVNLMDNLKTGQNSSRSP